MALHKQNILDKLEIKLNANIISKRSKTGNTAHGTILFDKNNILLGTIGVQAPLNFGGL